MNQVAPNTELPNSTPVSPATVNSAPPPDERTEEERALEEELASCKTALENARKAVADTDFYQMTEHVPELGRIKFKVRKHLRGHLAKVVAIQWGSDSQLLLSASQDSRLIVWDTFSGKKIHMITMKTAWVMGCAMSPSLNLVASGGLDNEIALFTLKSRDNTAQHLKDLTGHTGYVGCLRFTDEQHLLSTSGDKTCGLWDIETSKMITQYHGHANDLTCVAVSKQVPTMFVTSSSDCTCRLWDMRSSEAVQYFDGHQGDVNGVNFFPESTYAFASASDDGSCRLWDIRADQAIGVYIDDFIECGSTSVAVSKSGRLLIAGYDDYNCHVWDLLREERVGILTAHEDRVCQVTISESGVGVATASWDSTCIVWTSKC